MKVNCLFFLILLGSLLLHVEGISLLQLKSLTESQGNEKEDEGFSTQALPDNLGQQDDAIPLAGGEEDTKLPEIDPASNGDSCLLSGSSGDIYYEYIDATGLDCQCELCLPGHIVARNCTCDRATSDIPQRTECRLVEQGKQYMPVHNKCTTGIDCKACLYPWIVKMECPATSDTECECGSEGYSVDGNDCIPIPRCDVDHEPRFGDGEQYNIMVCQRCEEGYSQPKSNSTDKCLKIPDPTMLGTQTPTDVTPTPGPTQKRCFSLLEVVLIAIVCLVVGGGVVYLLTKKPWDCLYQRCTKAEDSKPSLELEEIVADNGVNAYRTRDEANTNEPSASSPLTSDSNIGKNAHKRPGGKRARKRGGHFHRHATFPQNQRLPRFLLNNLPLKFEM